MPAGWELEFEAATLTPVIHVGETGAIEFRLRNPTGAAVDLHFNSGCQILPYIEEIRVGVVHPPGGGWFCTAALTTLHLDPGETIIRTVTVRGGAPQPAIYPDVPLPPGRYVVYARMEWEPRMSAETNRVELRVLE